MEQNQPTSVVIIKSSKSVVLAIILSALVGPLGMLYSTIKGAIIMFIIGLFFAIIDVTPLLIMAWVIDIIWSIIAVNSYNEKLYEGVIPNSTPNLNNKIATNNKEVETMPLTEEQCELQREAEMKSDDEIDTILSGSISTLNVLYVEALKDVQIKRIKSKKLNDERHFFYDEAAGKTSEQIDQLLLSANTLHPIYIKALNYIKRSNALVVKSTYEGFVLTFELGYVAPETEEEKEERYNAEKEAYINESKIMLRNEIQ